MATTTLERGAVECKVLLPENETCDGVLDVGGDLYSYGSRRGGYSVQKLSSMAVYNVRLAGGRLVACDCGDWKYRRPARGCKHMQAAAAAMRDW